MLATASAIFSQKVFKGTSTYNSDVVCHIDAGKVYKGTSPYSSDILARFDGTSLYRGNSSYSSDVVMTWRDGKIYRGRSPMPTPTSLPTAMTSAADRLRISRARQPSTPSFTAKMPTTWCASPSTAMPNASTTRAHDERSGSKKNPPPVPLSEAGTGGGC